MGLLVPELIMYFAPSDQADRPLHVTPPYCREDNTVVHHE